MKKLVKGMLTMLVLAMVLLRAGSVFACECDKDKKLEDEVADMAAWFTLSNVDFEMRGLDIELAIDSITLDEDDVEYVFVQRVHEIEYVYHVFKKWNGTEFEQYKSTIYDPVEDKLYEDNFDEILNLIGDRY